MVVSTLLLMLPSFIPIIICPELDTMREVHLWTEGLEYEEITIRHSTGFLDIFLLAD